MTHKVAENNVVREPAVCRWMDGADILPSYPPNYRDHA